MKKGVLVFLALLSLSIIAGSVWYIWKDRTSMPGETNTVLQEKIIYKQETASEPSWIPAGNEGPWYQDLMIAYSNDGLVFTEKKLFIPHAGVGHLLLTDSNELIATFQYFSYVNQEMFDKIAYSISDDYGKTWSPVKLVDLTPPTSGGFMVPLTAVDPTLMQLKDGSFRLYFTYETPQDEGPTLYSATSDSIDGKFTWEGKQLDSDGTILDPAVIYFDNTWHHYTTYHEDFGSDTIRNVHSTSDTGTDFEREEDIEIEMSFLGDVIPIDNGIRFYADGITAFSEDGYEWEIEDGASYDGADPGVAEMPDGSFVIIYTAGGK